MDTDEDTHQEEEAFSEPATAPSQKTVLILILCLFLGFVIVLAHFALSLNTNPEKECTYRGGKWSLKSKECLFEDGVGGGVQQVGMTVKTLLVTVPNLGSQVSFDAVEIGSPKEYSKTFPLKEGGEGSITLMNNVARVHGVTGDLVLPFVVQSGGTGSFIYLGVFKKTDAGYTYTDSLFVGDRISPERIMLAEHADAGTYTARFTYRDRLPGEAMTATPREPKTLEIAIKDQHVTNSFVISRDGLEYARTVRVSSPIAHASVASPLTVTGFAQGSWFSEASFPITLRDSTGAVLAHVGAQAKGAWQTSEFVPFSATLTFTLPKEQIGTSGVLIIERDNPSGLPKNAESFSIPVVF